MADEEPCTLPEPRRRIDQEHPLFYFSLYGKDPEALRVLADGAWNAFPPAVREHAAFLLSHGSAPSYLSDDALDHEFLRHAERRGMPLLMLTDLEGRVEENVLRSYGNQIGVCGPEFPERFGYSGLHRAADRAARHGGLAFWQFLFNYGSVLDRDPDTAARYRAERGSVVLEIKANGFPEWWNPAEDGRERLGRFVHYAEVLLGAWLAGEAGNWGYHPEIWQWYELGNYTRLFEYSQPGTRFRLETADRGMYNTTFHNLGFCGYPENFMAQQVLNMAIHGCAVFSFEHGFSWGLVHDGRLTGPIDERGVLPMLDLVARRGLIPSRGRMLERVRAASLCDLPMGPELNASGTLWPNSFRKLYATTSVFLQDDGRYGLIPCLPRHSPPAMQKRFECFPTGYRYTYLPFLNALYPREGRGSCFIARDGSTWYVINPYENVDKDADFELPLLTNGCSRLCGRLAAHGLAVVEERPDRLDIHLGNFRLDKNEFWDRGQELLAGDVFADAAGRIRKGMSPEAAVEAGARVRKEIWARIRSRPVMAGARRTTLFLEGHGCDEPPQLEVEGHEGSTTASHWDAAVRRYVLDVDHNGVVRLTVRASGPLAPREPPQALSRNLALDRPARVSSSSAGHGAEAAVDGIHGTGWRPARGGWQWLSVDLGRPQPVSAYKLVGEAGKGGRTVVRFQAGSSENGPWETLDERVLTGDFFRVNAVDLAGEARWVRLLVRAPRGRFLLRELGVYRGPNGALKTWLPLIEARRLGDLLGLLGPDSSRAERAAVEEAAWDQRCRVSNPAAWDTEVLKALRDAAEPAVAATMVRLLGRRGGDEALAAVRGVLADGREEVRNAARWALVQWPDAGAFDDVLRVARAAADLSLRAHALRWLLPRVKRKPARQRHLLLAEMLSLATEGKDKLACIEALRTARCREALEAVLSCVDDPLCPSSILGPARAVGFAIAARIRRSDPEAARLAVVLFPPARREWIATAVPRVAARGPTAPGLLWRLYEPLAVAPDGAGPEEPVPVAQGIANAIRLPEELMGRRGSGCWLEFDGLLRVPRTSSYALNLRSDRDACLLLGRRRRPVLRSDSGVDGWAVVRLREGCHPLRIRYDIGPLGTLHLGWRAADCGIRRQVLSWKRKSSRPFSVPPITVDGVPAEALRHRVDDGSAA